MFQSGAGRVWKIARDAPREECLDVFQRVGGFGFGPDGINGFSNVAVRYLVDGFCPVKMPIERAGDLVLRAWPPLSLVEVLLACLGEDRRVGVL